MTQDILTHVEAGVMTVTLNRVARKNSINTAMYAALADAFAQARDDAAVRVVVLQGHETIFSAGNDIADFQAQPAVPTVPQAERPVFRFMSGLATFPKPVIASVCGPAVGIGTTMLFHCDLVYAGDNAAFSMPFVNLGICPEFASTLLVPQMFGYHRAAEALLLGEPFMAEAALEAGLVNRVLPPTEANGYAAGIARKLAAKPSTSLAASKRLMKGEQQAQVLKKIEEEGAIFTRMLSEPAAREAFGAFMDKRKPDFSKL